MSGVGVRGGEVLKRKTFREVRGVCKFSATESCIRAAQSCTLYTALHSRGFCH